MTTRKRSTLFTAAERRLATAVSRLARCNPFVPEERELRRAILGRDFVVVPHRVEPDPNAEATSRVVAALVDTTCGRLEQGVAASDNETTIKASKQVERFKRYSLPVARAHERTSRTRRGQGRRALTVCGSRAIVKPRSAGWMTSSRGAPG